MADISSEISPPKLPKTIDNLGIDTSRKYAESESIRQEAKRFFEQTKYGPLAIEKETFQPTPSKSDELLGRTVTGTFATFLPHHPPSTKVTALLDGRLAASIGDGKDLQKKISEAPPQLQKNKENFQKINNFADTYEVRDRDCIYIAGKSKQYSRG